MKRHIVWATLVLAASLAACTERPQAGTTHKGDGPASKGTGTQFVAAGWKAGDALSWEEQTRARTQYGQNDYSPRSGGK